MANRSIVGLEATAQKNMDTTQAILVMHAITLADTATATYNVGKQLARKAVEQLTQTIGPSLVTFKPVHTHKSIHVTRVWYCSSLLVY